MSLHFVKRGNNAITTVRAFMFESINSVVYDNKKFTAYIEYKDDIKLPDIDDNEANIFTYNSNPELNHKEAIIEFLDLIDNLCSHHNHEIEGIIKSNFSPYGPYVCKFKNDGCVMLSIIENE